LGKEAEKNKWPTDIRVGKKFKLNPLNELILFWFAKVLLVVVQIVHMKI
jgi:hypothetical protein